MAFDDWAKAILHTATEDPTATPYDEKTTASIALLTGYASKEIGLLTVGHKFDREGESTKYVDGEISDRGLRRRLSFEMELYPLKYDGALSTWNVADYDELCAMLDAPYKWLEIVGTEHTYHTAANAIPVVAEGLPDRNLDRESGEWTVVVRLKKSFAE